MLAFVLGCVVPAFLLSVVCTALLCRWAPAWGLVDHPGPRKVHEQATPMGGGVAPAGPSSRARQIPASIRGPDSV